MQRQSLAAKLTYETTVYRAVDAGVAVDDLAEALGLPPETVQRIVDQFEWSGRADRRVVD